MRTRPILGLAVVAGLAACATSAVVPERAPPVRVVVISDLNGAYGSTEYPPAVGATVRNIRRIWRPDLVLVAGDLVAGQQPSLPDATVRAMWSAFDSVVAAPLREAGIPLVAALGNHDASAYPAHARDRALAVEYWRGPSAAPSLPLLDGRHYPLRYTLVHRGVFIAVWDATNEESSRDAELTEWLRLSLATPQARAARHRIVVSHLPLYAVAEGRDRPGEVLADGDALRARLEAWGATAFVSGHHHAYFPARRGSLDLLNAGALGDGPRPLLGSAAPPRRTVTVLGLHADSMSVTTFEVHPQTGEPTLLPLESLPCEVSGRSGRVTRRDVAGRGGRTPDPGLCDGGRKQSAPGR